MQFLVQAQERKITSFIAKLFEVAILKMSSSRFPDTECLLVRPKIMGVVLRQDANVNSYRRWLQLNSILSPFTYLLGRVRFQKEESGEF